MCVSFNPLLAWGPKMIKNLWSKLIFVSFTLRGLIKQCIVNMQPLLVNINTNSNDWENEKIGI